MTNQTSTSDGAFRKPYQSPRLLKFGDVGELTQAVGQTGGGDGSGELMLKTRP